MKSASMLYSLCCHCCANRRVMENVLCRILLSLHWPTLRFVDVNRSGEELDRAECN